MLFEQVLPESRREGETAIVPVCGPLMHHADFFFDSYDAITSRVKASIESGAKRVVLAIDSPGGLVSGCFESSRAIREMCVKAGVELVAYVDGQATSAAYALACAAQRIVIPPSGVAGSIGVIYEILDLTARNAAEGVRVGVITSGARKADGTPNAPITSETEAAAQGQVDQLAELFFGHVAAMRGVSADAVRALEAGIVIGASAVALGLADEVGTLETAIAGKATAMDLEAIKKALAELAAAGDEKAKKALATFDEETVEEAPEKEAAPADDEKEASASAASAASDDKLDSLASVVRNQILAARPDIDAATAKWLRKQPLASVQEYCELHPKKKPAANAYVDVTPTRGETQGTPKDTGPIRRDGTAITYSAMTRAQAVAYREAKEKVSK